MILNKLKMNDTKTEFIIFRMPQMKHDLNGLSVNVGDSQIVPSVKVRNLGVILDQSLTFNDHISAICQSVHLHISLSARILHRAPPPRLQVDQNFLTQKIVADPKMRCHQKSFGIWRVTEAILGKKTCFFSKNIF